MMRNSRRGREISLDANSSSTLSARRRYIPAWFSAAHDFAAGASAAPRPAFLSSQSIYPLPRMRDLPFLGLPPSPAAGSISPASTRNDSEVPGIDAFYTWEFGPNLPD